MKRKLEICGKCRCFRKGKMSSNYPGGIRIESGSTNKMVKKFREELDKRDSEFISCDVDNAHVEYARVKKDGTMIFHEKEWKDFWNKEVEMSKDCEFILEYLVTNQKI